MMSIFGVEIKSPLIPLSAAQGFGRQAFSKGERTAPFTPGGWGRRVFRDTQPLRAAGGNRYQKGWGVYQRV